MAVVTFKGLGRRKSSTALVKLTPGSGKLVINNRKAEDYFPNKIVIQDMRQPLEVTKTASIYDINVVVNGGGFTGQAGAIRLGIARALVNMNPELKKSIKTTQVSNTWCTC